MKNLERLQLTPITPCANVACSNELQDGSFALARLEEMGNIGDGTGHMELLLCTPCLYALEGAIAQTTD